MLKEEEEKLALLLQIIEAKKIRQASDRLYD